MSSFLKTAILRFFLPRTEIKLHFCNPETKLVQKHTFYIRKYQFESLTFCDPTGPFSVVALHGLRVQNGLDFLILSAKVTINIVLHGLRRIFYFGDLL